ncbi:MAG: YbhB/YbcL family Raf kinase inhibitor-like protein [Proteobacteria bacterium]|jgi:Raf kinase inhibitor-like YbhB/YbcL family protein|nr:YbhB/YbcL family Raf kinase inhibitor-like protein [Pseudomonadota bacterium]
MKKMLAFMLVLSSSAFAGSKDFEIRSNSWKDGEAITLSHVFNSFGCTGQNVSPAISWKNQPKETKSLALTIFDPDAPTGSGWWHWVVYNIPAKIRSLPAGIGKQGEAKLANGAVQGETDYGVPGYGGPCPPAGDKPHHYIITVHALNVEKLDLPANAPAAMVSYYINNHSIAKDSLTSLYLREK